jgi:hypothetical protein
MGFAPPPYDRFALLASAHTDALGYRHSPRVLAMNASYECIIKCILAPRNTPWRISSAYKRCLYVALCYALSHARLITSGRWIGVEPLTTFVEPRTREVRRESISTLFGV